MNDHPTAEDLVQAYEEWSNELDPETIAKIDNPQDSWTVEEIQAAITSSEGQRVSLEENRMLALEQANEMRSLRALGFQKAKRAQKIVDLTLQGYNPKDISGKLQLPEPVIRETLERIFERVRAPKVNQLREVMNYQLDQLTRTYLPVALLGDQKAAGLVLKIIERKSKLNRIEQDVNLVNNQAPWMKVYQAILTDPTELENVVDAEVVENAGNDNSNGS